VGVVANNYLPGLSSHRVSIVRAAGREINLCPIFRLTNRPGDGLICR
jgi:hypothetical protein